MKVGAFEVLTGSYDAPNVCSVFWSHCHYPDMLQREAAVLHADKGARRTTSVVMYNNLSET